MSSTNILARCKIAGSSSWSPALSAPIAATSVPGPIQLWFTGRRYGNHYICAAHHFLEAAADTDLKTRVFRLLGCDEFVEGLLRAAQDTHLLPLEHFIAGGERPLRPYAQRRQSRAAS